MDDLLKAAPAIGSHGLDDDEFWRSGIFRSAIESIRGTQSASMAEKRSFVDEVLGYLKEKSRITSFSFTGSGDRHDYQVSMDDGTQSVIESKGCLDGQNTTIFQRPQNAEEFVVWSLCQNPGSDPQHNAWSGIHTRIGGKLIAEKEKVDGLIIWDMLCGTAGRPCPKLKNDLRGIKLPSGRFLPPPCIYLFPRTVPDPRNNPSPRPWSIDEIKLLYAIWKEFQGQPSDLTEIHIDTRMNGANVERKTTLIRAGVMVTGSNWTELKRASR
ncbi:MAG: hypothetical protein H7833_09770 [Magnetococcus sp. DMHC-1]